MATLQGRNSKKAPKAAADSSDEAADPAAALLLKLKQDLAEQDQAGTLKEDPYVCIYI